MNQKTKYIGLLAILPLAMIALSPDLIGEADAQKSEGNTAKQSPNPMDQQLTILFVEQAFAAHQKVAKIQ